MHVFQTKEYAQKKQAAGGKLVDATKEVEKHVMKVYLFENQLMLRQEK